MSLAELLVIAIIALLVIPPKQLPKLLRRAGNAYADLKRQLKALQHGMHSNLKANTKVDSKIDGE